MLRVTAAFLVALTLFGCGGMGRSIVDARSPFASTASPRPDACKDQDRAAAKAEWAKVRTSFPYHLQTVAVSPAFKSGCRALIVTEPPPGVTMETLQQVAPELLGSSAIEKHTVGYDGWTADVVFTVPPVGEQDLAETVAGLHRALFGTTYRPQTIDTNTRPPALDPRSTPLDITIGPGDLNRWLLVEQSSEFRPLRGGPALRFRQLLDAGEAGVYVDARHGLVGWTIPRSADINRMRALVRQFATESDLIVGAIASEDTVAILARRRIADPLVLQPLRFETVSLLAAVGNEHLVQSYERNHFVAGKLSDYSDWAPILLSPELLDTEYGSVLNIADQFLKSWSENGLVKYQNFSYPAPAKWAFPVPMFVMTGSNGVTFNWNTANAGATIAINDLDVFWLRRTGALNVSYFPKREDGSLADPTRATQNLEEKGHNFFAESQNPFLTRVVEYNALYQIFRRYDLRSSAAVVTEENSSAAQVLSRATRSTLSELRSFDMKTLFERLDSALSSEPEHVRTGWWLEIGMTVGELRSLDDKDLDTLATALATPRAFVSLPPRLDLIHRTLARTHNALSLVTTTKHHKAYASTITPKPGTWIHTPSIVVSSRERSSRLITGGHNLDAEVHELRYEPRRKWSATLDLADGNEVSTIGSMELDRVTLGQQGVTLGKKAEARAPREALGIHTEPAPPTSGWRTVDGPPVGPISYDVKVAKIPGGYSVTNSEGRQFESTTMEGAVELALEILAPKRGKLVVETVGFSPDEMRHFSYNLERSSQTKVGGVIQSPSRSAHAPLETARAKIGEGEVRSYAGGDGAVGLAIEIPVANRSTAMRIQIAVPKATPAQLRSHLTRLKQSARTFFTGHAPGTADDIGLELRKVMKQLVPDGGVKIKIEFADMRITELEQPRDTRGTSRHAS